MLMKRQELLRCKPQCRKSEDWTRTENTQRVSCAIPLEENSLGATCQRNRGFTRYSFGHYTAGRSTSWDFFLDITPGPALQKHPKHRAKSYDSHHVSHSSLTLSLNEFPFRGVHKLISGELSKWKACRPGRRRSTFLDWNYSFKDISKILRCF